MRHDPHIKLRSVYFKSRCDLGVITLESDRDSVTQGSLNATKPDLEIFRKIGPFL